MYFLTVFSVSHIENKIIRHYKNRFFYRFFNWSDKDYTTFSIGFQLISSKEYKTLHERGPFNGKYPITRWEK